MGSKIIFLSDIHIGNNSPTNWYQSSIHQPYLMAALQYVIDNKDEIQELVILGDLIDFWTYLPDTQPPPFYSYDITVDSIMSQNPAIFGSISTGKIGKLGEAVRALNGNVSIVHGNHDMTLTQKMLDKIPTGGPYRINLQSDIYFPLGTKCKDIACTHGHIFSMLCAPDHEAANLIAPLPLGYYVTRAGAYLAAKGITPSKPNVAFLPNAGEPIGLNLSYYTWAKIFAVMGVSSLGAAISEGVQAETGLGWNVPIKLSDGTHTTLNNAYYHFSNLFDTWYYKKGIDGVYLGYSGAYDALKYPDDDNDLSPYARQMASTYKAKIVVMGHTHVPKDNTKPLQSLTNSDNNRNFIYANAGFNCPSIPDMQAPDEKRPTFVEIDESDSGYTVSMMQVEKSGTTYKVNPDPNIPPERIGK